jgi:hypothetical protein
MLADLLEQWFEAASPGWAADLGHQYVTKLKTEDIDDFYGYSSAQEGAETDVLSLRGRSLASTASCTGPRPGVRWEWLWYNPAPNATPPRLGLPRSGHQLRTRSRSCSKLCGRATRRFTATSGSQSRRELGEASSSLFDGATWTRCARRLLSLVPSYGDRTARRPLGRRHTDPTGWNSTKGTFANLMAHRARAETHAADVGVELTADAFVFSSSPDGLAPWKPNWVTKHEPEPDRPAPWRRGPHR